MKQTTATWYTPAEKLPPEDYCVVVTVSGRDGNINYDHALQVGSWAYDGSGWMIEGFSEDAQFVVNAWCYLELPDEIDGGESYGDSTGKTEV